MLVDIKNATMQNTQLLDSSPDPRGRIKPRGEEPPSKTTYLAGHSHGSREPTTASATLSQVLLCPGSGATWQK